MIKIKFLVFNEENKMLVFSKKTDIEKYFLPTMYITKDSIEIPEVLHILGLSMKDSEMLFDFKNINKEVKEKRFLGIYHEFSTKDYDAIYESCIGNGIIPFMVTYDELEHINYLRKKEKAIIDFGILPSAKVLKKKLNYEEY